MYAGPYAEKIVVEAVPVTVRLPPVEMSVLMVVEAFTNATTKNTETATAIVTGSKPLLIEIPFIHYVII